MQDTFYINDQVLLRTHTFGSQVHFMKNNEPPVRILINASIEMRHMLEVIVCFIKLKAYMLIRMGTFELKGTEYFAKEFLVQMLNQI